MNIMQNQELIERVIHLAEKKATGTPYELSVKLVFRKEICIGF